MKKIFAGILLWVIVVACGGAERDKTLMVTGNIDGLKKGTLYLQHIPDSTLVTVDSIVIKGDGSFVFETELNSPEVYYLYLEKADNNDFNDRITFFAEPGTITINTSWNTFATKAVIEGSETHKEMETYQGEISRLHQRNIELMQLAATPEIQNDSAAFDSIRKISDKMILRGYLYTLNYAMTHKNSYLSPYIALLEAENANPSFLDSIYKTLDPEVAESKYGKKLKVYLEEVAGK